MYLILSWNAFKCKHVTWSPTRQVVIRDRFHYRKQEWQGASNVMLWSIQFFDQTVMDSSGNVRFLENAARAFLNTINFWMASFWIILMPTHAIGCCDIIIWTATTNNVVLKICMFIKRCLGLISILLPQGIDILKVSKSH